MINEILSIFDQPLSDKCWIDTYGKLAIPAKQKIGEKWKRFPISTMLISQPCEDLNEHFTTLSPDDTKTSVSFWRAMSKIRYSPLKDVSFHRHIKRADVDLQFVCWFNIRKASGINDASNWDAVITGIVKDAVRTIDCNYQSKPTGVEGITNLKIDVVGIGNIETWRKSMSEFSIDNIEAVSVWPFSGFTLDCKLSCLVRGTCFEPFECSSEFDATGFCPPE